GAHLVVGADLRRRVQIFRLWTVERRATGQSRVNVAGGGDAIVGVKVVEIVGRDVKTRLVVRGVADHLIVIGILLCAVAAQRDAARRALDEDAQRSAADVQDLADARNRIAAQARARLLDELTACRSRLLRERHASATEQRGGDAHAERDEAWRPKLISPEAERRSSRRRPAGN